MFGKIISISWKSFLRSPAFSQNLATTIMMAFLGIYFGLSFIIVSAAAPYLISEHLPNTSGPQVFGKYFIYFLIYLFLTKLIFQNFGFQELKLFILQKVPKSTIFHYILTKSALDWSNTISYLSVTAYLVSASYLPAFSENLLSQALVLYGLIIVTNYKAFLFDKQLSINNIATGSILVLVVLINFLDFKGYLPLGRFFESIYAFLTSNVAFAIIPLLGSVLLYYLSFKTLRSVSYLEDVPSEEGISNINIGSGLFAKFGKSAEMMEMETKLIFRNKRSKNMLYMIALLLIYPLIIHGQGDQMDSMGWMMFVAIFCSGGYAITYGQLLLSWNSGHFDLLLTKMESIKEIFKAKYYLQCVIIILQSCIMVLWGFYKFEYFYLIPTMMFYNLGVVLFMYMLLASYNSKKVDTNKGAAMNYEGFSMALFLIIIPIMALPVLLYYGFNAIGHPMWGIFGIGLLGFVGFVFHDKLIDISVALFQKNKYKIGTAFRSK